MMKKALKVQSAKGEDSFDALFDYSKTLPPCDDSSQEDDELELTKVAPKPKFVGVGLSLTNGQSVVGSYEVPLLPRSHVDAKAKNDDDWLAPPPQLPGRQGIFNPTLDSIKRQKQELHEILLSSTKSLKSCEAETKTTIAEKSVDIDEPPEKRQKILLRMQRSQGELQGYRIYADEPLEKLFARYAQNYQSSSATSFTFRFDGDKIDPLSKPKDLDMEDEDIIEVFESRA